MNGMSCGQGSGVRKEIGGKEGSWWPRRIVGTGQLITSMGLVWREARNCAQRTITPQERAYLCIGSACHSLPVYMYIILHAFFLFSRIKIKHVS
jgi:hypothetical protein